MTMENRAFQPGNTVTQYLAVTAGAASITLNVTAGTRQVRVVNNGTTAIWLAFDTTATTTQGMVMLGNTVESFTLPQQCSSISVISTGAAGTVAVTTGNGT
jgi:archaellum component FlaF (FlaF/FlaG flagellin family)